MSTWRRRDRPLVFHHACKLGLEGIVSKRKDSRYRSGRSPDWIKSKSPNAPAVRRELRKIGGAEGRCLKDSSKSKGSDAQP
jgi:ATP-dependent DNA ligase